MASGGSYINRKQRMHISPSTCAPGWGRSWWLWLRSGRCRLTTSTALRLTIYALPQELPLEGWVLPHHVEEHGTEHAIVSKFIDCGLGKINETRKTIHIETKQLIKTCDIVIINRYIPSQHCLCLAYFAVERMACICNINQSLCHCKIFSMHLAPPKHLSSCWSSEVAHWQWLPKWRNCIVIYIELPHFQKPRCQLWITCITFKDFNAGH